MKMLTPFEVWHAREVYDVRFNTDYMLDKHTPEYEFPFRGWYEHMEKIRKARKDSMRWQETTRNRVAIPNERYVGNTVGRVSDDTLAGN